MSRDEVMGALPECIYREPPIEEEVIDFDTEHQCDEVCPSRKGSFASRRCSSVP